MYVCACMYMYVFLYFSFFTYCMKCANLIEHLAVSGEHCPGGASRYIRSCCRRRTCYSTLSSRHKELCLPDLSLCWEDHFIQWDGHYSLVVRRSICHRSGQKATAYQHIRDKICIIRDWRASKKRFFFDGSYHHHQLVHPQTLEWTQMVQWLYFLNLCLVQEFWQLLLFLVY